MPNNVSPSHENPAFDNSGEDLAQKRNSASSHSRDNARFTNDSENSNYANQPVATISNGVVICDGVTAPTDNSVTNSSSPQQTKSCE